MFTKCGQNACNQCSCGSDGEESFLEDLGTRLLTFYMLMTRELAKEGKLVLAIAITITEFELKSNFCWKT